MGEHEGLLTASSHVHLIRKKKTQPFHFFFHDSENYLLEKREKKRTLGLTTDKTTKNRTGTEQN